MTRALRPPKAAQAAQERPVDAADPTQLVQYAVARGVTPAELKDLMDLADRERHRIAAERFGEALAGFQGDMPPISKTRAVMNRPDKGGGVRYKFAALEDIDAVARPLLAKWKLSVSGSINSEGDGVKATWTIRCGAHKEDRVIFLPKVAHAGIAQGVNPVQDLGAWMTYIRRYTYCLALNIVVEEEDTDANAIRDVLLLSGEQRHQLDDWITTGVVKTDGTIHKLTAEGLLKWLQGDLPEAERSLDRLTQQQFARIVSTFKVRYEPKGGAA